MLESLMHRRLVLFCFLPLFLNQILTVGRAQSRFAITGATLIDVSQNGRSANDIDDAVVLVENGWITATGRGIAIPTGFVEVSAKGAFLVPGLVDGFAVINDQNYANALLYSGVTSVVGVSGFRRGKLFVDGNPSPFVYRLAGLGDEPAKLADWLQQTDEAAERGYAVLLLMYRMKPEKLRAVAQRARERGLATIGELGLASYQDGLRCGVDAFVHTTRYAMDMAPRKMAHAVAMAPFSNDLESPKWQYYKWLTKLSGDSQTVLSYAQRLTRGEAFLMPTASLLYLDQPFAKNPWRDPAAKILDPDTIDSPADQESGKHSYDPAHMDAYASLAEAQVRIERTFHKAGCRYLAGSATDVWGTIGLHDRNTNPSVAVEASLAHFKT